MASEIDGLREGKAVTASGLELRGKCWAGRTTFEVRVTVSADDCFSRSGLRQAGNIELSSGNKLAETGQESRRKSKVSVLELKVRT